MFLVCTAVLECHGAKQENSLPPLQRNRALLDTPRSGRPFESVCHGTHNPRHTQEGALLGTLGQSAGVTLDASDLHVCCTAILESQAFGQYQAKADAAPAQPSGALSDTPGQIAGVHLDAATPAGHAMQQASHQDQSGAAVLDEKLSIKAVVSDWIDETLLPAINAQARSQAILSLQTGCRTLCCCTLGSTWRGALGKTGCM